MAVFAANTLVGCHQTIIIETFVQCKIEEDPKMHWNPNMDSPKTEQSCNPESPCQERMTMVVVMLV